MYDIVNYYNAETIKEAVTLLKEHPEARIISGGSEQGESLFVVIFVSFRTKSMTNP